MTTAQIVVTIAGAALIAFILWLFFGKKAAGEGVQVVDILVNGSYQPDLMVCCGNDYNNGPAIFIQPIVPTTYADVTPPNPTPQRF